MKTRGYVVVQNFNNTSERGSLKEGMEQAGAKIRERTGWNEMERNGTK